MYRPTYAKYQSESDTESDSDSDSTDSSGSSDSSASSTGEGFQDYPDYSTLANALAGQSILDLSGSTPTPDLGFPVTKGGYSTFSNLTVTPDPSGNLLKPQTQSVTSIIMVDSRDRDRGVFAQPTSLTLRLPRTYKNVVNFQIVQMKLLSAFFYFRRSKENIDISILELGRTFLRDGLTVPAVIKNTIREGTYDINSLLNELNTQLNNTPIFYDYINGISDFAAKFAVTGDFSLNFNYPGDYYYDSLLDQFVANPTMDTIVSKYFVQRLAGLSSYTADQIKVAYYYPVLKEVLLDQNFADGVIDLSLPTTEGFLLPGETPTSRVIYTFQGINDPVILELVGRNVTTLDTYRVEHTFRYYLINKYNCYFEPQSNKVIIASPSLNTSLVNLLNTKRAEYFAAQLSFYGLTLEQYNNLTQTNQILLAVLTDMYFYIQRYLAAYFGIPFNAFTAAYLASGYRLPIKDGLDAIGVPSAFTGQALVSPAAASQDILSTLRQPAPPLWPQLQGIGATFAYMNPVLSGESGAAGLPLPSWSDDLDAADPAHPIVAPNVTDPNNPNTTEVGFLYTNPRTGTGEYVLPLEATRYTTFRFKSPVRQTVRIATGPRPTKYRYPAYNAVTYDASNVALFDNSYNFVTAAGPIDVPGISITGIPGFSTLTTAAGNFGMNYSTATGLWAGSTVTLSVAQPRQFYEFYTPWPAGAPSTPAVTYPLRVTLAHGISGETFASPIYMFLYHDRAAFMADVSGNQNPLHYKQVISTTTDISTVSLDMTAYANKHYYLIARPIAASFATERYRIAPWYPEGTTYTSLTSTLVGFDPLADPSANLGNFNYAANADPAFIQLPIQSTLWTGPANDPATSTLFYSTPAIGYDVNGVSTDLTNYVGFIQGGGPASNAVPGALLRADPTTGYIFQAKSAYNPSTQTYFYSASQNTILTYDGASVYMPSTVVARQASIVHWYGTTTIPTTTNQVLPAPTNLSPFIPLYTTAIGGYTFNTLADLSGNTVATSALDLGDGVMGIAFVPDAGTWDIDRFMFQSAAINGAADPNAEIRYLGIFPAAVTSNHSFQSLALSNATAVLAFSSTITYNSSNDNFGFDEAWGTYYEFVRQTGATNYLTGYRQAPYEYNFNVNSYYVAVPFTAASTPTFYRDLVGSPVAYPRYSAKQVVPAVASPIGPLSPPTGRQIVLPDGLLPGGDPALGPPAGYTDTQSQYEQSIPITNNMLTFATPYPLMTSTNTMRTWSPLPYAPNTVVADCSGFLLLRDTDFRVFSYPFNTPVSTFTELYQFTADQVFPPSSNTDYLGAAANETQFAFFGLSNSAGPSPTLVIRTMNPATGSLDGMYTEPAPLGFQSSVTLFRATYNNGGGYVMSAQAYDAGSATTVRTVLGKANASTTSYTVLTDLTPPAGLTQYYVAQSPKETAGRFWIFPADATGVATQAVLVNPNLVGASGSPPVAGYQIAVGPLASPTAYPEPAIFDIAPATSPVVTREVARDRIFFLSAAGPTQFYEAVIPSAPTYGTTSTTASTVSSVYTFPVAPSTLIAGATGGLWATVSTSIYGNRGDAIDAPKPVDQAWQIFYPVQRIVMRQVSKQIIASTPGTLYPEYPHTAIAAYDGSGNITADTSGRWGLELSTNFITADFRFQGPQFNANDYAVPVEDNRTTSDYYYFTVRNYTPTEKSQVLLKVSAPNRYTFGYVTPLDLSGEISTAKVVSTTNSQFETYFWDPIYRNSILSFDSKFIIDSNGQTFGAGVIPGYGGSNISSVTGWGDFYGRFRSLFQTYSTSIQLASTINSAVNSNLSNFITTDLQYIIPPAALNRQRFTDPLRFSILWKSALLPAYANLEEEWGLGWNLGYTKADTPYETVLKATSFFKILDDYIFLRLNPEFDMNRMDTTLKENLAATQEPTGTTKSFYGKLLLAPFGSYAQTVISNPLSFNPPFGKMDRLTFQWVNQVGTVIDNADCEWNAVVQLVESVEIATVPKPDLISPQ